MLLLSLFPCFQVDSLHDRKDFVNVCNAMKVLGYQQESVETIWKVLAAILHLVGDGTK